MYQKCPICNGTGVIPTPNITSCFKTCDTCNGKKIISSTTGLPPMFPIISNEDLRDDDNMETQRKY